MMIKLLQNAENTTISLLTSAKHHLFVLTENTEKELPFGEFLQAKLNRTQGEFKDLAKMPMTVDLPDGSVASYVVLGAKLNLFQQHTLLRKALKPLLDEKPESISICVYGDEVAREAHACAAYYVATVNAAVLANRNHGRLYSHKSLYFLGSLYCYLFLLFFYG